MDYETFNLKSKGGRVAQYASIRTNYNLQILKESAKNYYCLQTLDNLPSPKAALVTQITPQKIVRIQSGIEKSELLKKNIEPKVFNEYWFITHVLDEMAVPKTCTLGYNSFKFDDEFTRNLLYRNLYDPYAREWQNNNSRFDVYFLVLATYVLNPSILTFPPVVENGVIQYHSITGKELPNFRLEELSKSNGISHTNAHDAFSDVEATIGLMKKIKEANEYFFEEIFAFRKKNHVGEWLYKNDKKPFIHISPFYGKENYCFAVLYPLYSIQNSMICLNLAIDIEPIIELEGDDLLGYLFPHNSLQNKNVVVFYFNQCPILANVSEYSEQLKTFNLDKSRMAKNLNLIKTHSDRIVNRLKPHYPKEFSSYSNSVDTDLGIYSSGFFNDLEKDCMVEFHLAIKNGLIPHGFSKLKSHRLKEMGLKVIARNFPEQLSEDQKSWWMFYARNKIQNKDFGAEYTLEEFNHEIADLLGSNIPNNSKLVLLELMDYVKSIKTKLRIFE
jgi:exodeoxyribonuclease-1